MNLLPFPGSTNLEPWQSLIVASQNAHRTAAEVAKMFDHEVGQKTWWIWGTAWVSLHIHNQMGRSKTWWVFTVHKREHVPDVHMGDGERDIFLLVITISNDEIALASTLCFTGTVIPKFLRTCVKLVLGSCTPKNVLSKMSLRTSWVRGRWVKGMLARKA